MSLFLLQSSDHWNDWRGTHSDSSSDENEADSQDNDEEESSKSDEVESDEDCEEVEDGHGIDEGSNYDPSELEELKGLTVGALKDLLRAKKMKVGGKKAELIDRLLGRNQIEKVFQSEDERREYLESLTVGELKERLKQRRLKVGGKKAELVNRLMGLEKAVPKSWKKSEARSLLIKLISDQKSKVHRMSAEEIHQSDMLFKSYPLDKFKEYLQKILESNAKQKEIVAVNEEEIWREELAFPREELTCHGYPFWDTHPARALLEYDVKNGTADGCSPKELRETRAEYLDFPLDIFRCHIYQEKRKQREKPGWVHLRNKKGQKTHEQEVNSMKVDWDIMQHKAGIEEITKMCEEWELRLEN